jgi:predicted nucleic acid-binding protein
MRLALDTNILAYAEGLGDTDRCAQARLWVARAAQADTVLPSQVLGELQRVLVVKKRLHPADARAAVLSWADAFEVAESSWTAMQAALDLCADHQLTMWDALILATAAEARCRILLTEDMQHGFTWRGLTLVNPFHTLGHPLLSQWTAA